MAKRAGLPWDCILGAEVVRCYKPDPQCYLDTADVLGLQPAECVMVAAHNDDLAAAAAIGLHPEFVVSPNEHGPSQDKDLEAPGPWALIFNAIVDLGRLTGSASYTLLAKTPL